MLLQLTSWRGVCVLSPLCAEAYGPWLSMFAYSLLASPSRNRNRLHGEADTDESATAMEVLPDGRAVSFESSFTWHDIDLRRPLPPLAELLHAEHLVGFRDGKRVYLATAALAVKYGIVEKSTAFSEHYGTSVYICEQA